MPSRTSVWSDPGTGLGATGAVALNGTSLREAAPVRRFRGNGRRSSVPGSLSGSKGPACLVALYEGTLRGDSTRRTSNVLACACGKSVARRPPNRCRRRKAACYCWCHVNAASLPWMRCFCMTAVPHLAPSGQCSCL